MDEANLAAEIGAALRLSRGERPEGVVRGEVLHVGPLQVPVTRVNFRGASLLLREGATDDWREHCPVDGGEPRLWSADVLSRLGDAVAVPIVDVRDDAATGLRRTVMRDHGHDLRARLTLDDSARLFRALSSMHARRLPSRPAVVPPLSHTLSLPLRPLLHLTGVRPTTESWVHRMLDEVRGLRARVPLLIDLLGPRLADAYLQLAADDGWPAMIDAQPATLLHGGLGPGTAALDGDVAQLIGWDLASWGPPAFDLQAHLWLHHRADRDDAAELGRSLWRDYRQRRAQLGGPLEGDPEAVWKLAFVAAVTAFGFTLADPLLPDGGDAETRKRVRALCTSALGRALDYREQLGA